MLTMIGGGEPRGSHARLCRRARNPNACSTRRSESAREHAPINLTATDLTPRRGPMPSARPFEPVIHARRRAHRGPSGADTSRQRGTPIPISPSRNGSQFASDLGADCIELSAAIHPDLADIPAEAMLDPVANTLDLRQPFDEEPGEASPGGRRRHGRRDRRRRVLRRPAARGPGHPAQEARLHDLGVMDAAVLFGSAGGVPASSAAISPSRWTRTSSSSSRASSRCCRRPRTAGCSTGSSSARCRGGRPSTTSTTTSATRRRCGSPSTRSARRNGVGDQFRIHYDPSHSILMGQDTRSMFQYLKDEGYAFLIAGMHVKGQVVDSRGVTAWGYGGQTVDRGDWIDGAVSTNPADLANSWKIQTVLCEHELPGTARHDPLAYLQNRSVDWLDHQLARARAARLRSGHDTAHRRARIPASTRAGQGHCSGRSSQGRSRSPATSTRRPPPCTRCSTTCWPRRASPSRASAARPTGADRAVADPPPFAMRTSSARSTPRVPRLAYYPRSHPRRWCRHDARRREHHRRRRDLAVVPDVTARPTWPRITPAAPQLCTPATGAAPWVRWRKR